MINVTLVDTLTGIRVECSGMEAASFLSTLLFPKESVVPAV